MFVPIHDANDLRHIRLQFVTLGLIGLNVAVWFLTALDGLESEASLAAAYGLGFIPAVANGYADLAPDLVLVPEPATYALMLAGIAGIGFVARRRRQD